VPQGVLERWGAGDVELADRSDRERALVLVDANG
jgi:hypothetical protein